LTVSLIIVILDHIPQTDTLELVILADSRQKDCPAELIDWLSLDHRHS
jgi:hypothetical protein